jgi:riboflavin kinase / FMN adenylyltransferase
MWAAANLLTICAIYGLFPVWISSSLQTVLTPTAIALGNFDGIHLGHRQVIEPVLAAREQAVLRLYATVVSFSPHPREFFSGQPLALLSPLEERVGLLEQTGVDQLMVLPFDEELASLSPEQFVRQILVEQMQAKHISVGKDFRFGHKRSGTAELLRDMAADYGVEVTQVSLQTCDGERISSSAVRAALQTGDVNNASRLLGRPYRLIGKVVDGQQLGRTIGFPTANLLLPPSKLVPAQGVYGVKVSAKGLNHGDPMFGVMNIGNRPTVDGTKQTIEVHLLDWAGDLYGQELTVELLEFIRSEQRFPSLDALKSQIVADCDVARSRLIA